MLSNLAWVLIILVAIISYYAFVLPPKDKLVFKLYQKRDELTLYAMNTPGKQDTEEYGYLVQMINVEIYLIKNNISFMDYYRSVIETTVENQKEVESILERIKQDEFMKNIFDDTFSIFEGYFKRKFKVFSYLFLKPIVYILKIFEKLKKKASLKKISRTIERTSSITENYERYMRMNSNVM